MLLLLAKLAGHYGLQVASCALRREYLLRSSHYLSTGKGEFSFSAPLSVELPRGFRRVNHVGAGGQGTGNSRSECGR